MTAYEKLKPYLPNRNNWFGWTALVLTMLISFLWLFSTTLHSDDFYYQRMPGPDDAHSMWTGEGELITSFSQIPEAVYNHRINVNGRISNAVYLAFQPLPDWVVRVICGAALAFLAWQFWSWCGKKSLRNRGLAIAIPIMFWTGMQWNDQMQSADFQFNYTLPSVILMGCLYFFFKRNDKPGVWGWILLGLCAVWHECFTIVFGAFLGTQWLFTRDRRTFIAVCILILGVVFQMSESSIDRMEYLNNSAGFKYYSWTQLISKAWLSEVAIVWWLIRRRKLEKPERRFLDRFGCGLLVSWAAQIFLIYYVLAPHRAHWPNDILAFAMILSIICTYKPIKVNNIVASILLVFYAAWGSSLIYWQIKISRFTNYCISELKKGKLVIADPDGMAEQDVPFWLMGMTHLQYYSFDYYWEYISMSNVTSRGRSKVYVLLPPNQATSPDINKLKPLPGDANMLTSGKNIVLHRHNGEKVLEKRFDVTFGPPTISVSPLDYLITYLKYGRTDTIVATMRVISVDTVEYGNDTLEFVSFERMPRTVLGRQVLAVSKEVSN